MREKHQKQMPLIDPPTGHPKEKELEAISIVLDSTPTICVWSFFYFCSDIECLATFNILQ
jgi:thiamine biosynthesis lipoprotein ApbE